MVLDENEGTKITENWRVYTFPGEHKIELIKPRELFISERSGNHRIKTEDGRLHIIPVGWLHIEIDSEVGKWER
jgi:hypothetical protein